MFLLKKLGVYQILLIQSVTTNSNNCLTIVLFVKTRRQNFKTGLIYFFNQLNNLQGTYIV